MTLSQISSHYAGMLKAHSASHEQTFAWEAIMTLANQVEILQKRVKELEKEMENVASNARYAANHIRPIG